MSLPLQYIQILLRQSPPSQVELDSRHLQEPSSCSSPTSSSSSSSFSSSSIHLHHLHHHHLQSIVIDKFLPESSRQDTSSLSPCLDLGNPSVDPWEVTFLGTAICQRVVAHHVPGASTRCALVRTRANIMWEMLEHSLDKLEASN